MGGWIIVQGNNENFKEQLYNFKRIFSVSGVPPLHIETKSYNNLLNVVLWSWSKPPIPDIHISCSKDKANLIVLHGAITGLGRFSKTKADKSQIGSIIVELWNRHGQELIPELNGSFSCAFINLQNQAITLITDRFASRPIWFSREGKIWYAGNSPAAIAVFFKSRPHLDAAGIWSFFATTRHVGSHGIYHGIQNLSAGEVAELKPSCCCKTVKWKRLKFTPRHEISAREWGKLIAGALQKSAKRLIQVTSDPHIFLSAGMDSRIAAATLKGELNAWTLASTHNIATSIVRRVAARLNINHKIIIRSPYWYLDTFEAAALVGGGNYLINHAHFTAPIQQIKESNPRAAILLGDMLENFNKHYFHQTGINGPSFIPKEIPDIFHNLYSYSHKNPSSLKSLFRPNIYEQIYKKWREVLIDISETIVEVSKEPEDCLDTLFRWNNCSYCPTYMMFECIWPLAEERNLMFDNDMADLHLSIPANIKGAGVLHLWTLWYLNKSLVILPEENSWLPPFAPKSWQNMAKKARPFLGRSMRKISSIFQKKTSLKTTGMWQLLHETYQIDKKYSRFIENCLFDKDALPPDIFNQEEIKTCWQEFLMGNSKRYPEIDTLISFGLLHKKISTSGLNFS